MKIIVYKWFDEKYESRKYTHLRFIEYLETGTS